MGRLTVDEAMEGDEYFDRQGRVWTRFSPSVLGGMWRTYDHKTKEVKARSSEVMRRWIARELHREECVGLAGCYDHPVAHALSGPPGRPCVAFSAYDRVCAMRPTLTEAIAAAEGYAREGVGV